MRRHRTLLWNESVCLRAAERRDQLSENPVTREDGTFLGEGQYGLTSVWSDRAATLHRVRERPKRLSELRRAIPSASKKALTASLRSLETARIVLRRDLSSSVLRVEYEIADTIREPLSALVDQLAEWGRSYGSDEVPSNSAKDNSSAVHSPNE
jgi:DNA-binding HxlR family transcriptional regulator